MSKQENNIKKYIAIKTGEPDYHQIYKYSGESDDGNLIYENYNWKRIYKSHSFCIEAIEELERNEANL